jgi:hypothetical protein
MERDLVIIKKYYKMTQLEPRQRMYQKIEKALPGFEPGFQEVLEQIRILSDNHYTIAP